MSGSTCTDQEPAAAVLWQATVLDRRFVLTNLAIAVLVPLGLTVTSDDATLRGFAYSAVVGVSVMGSIQALYILALPRSARVFRHRGARMAAHGGVVVMGSGIGATLAAGMLFVLARIDPLASIAGLFRTSLVVSAVVVGILVTVDGLQQRLLEARTAEDRATQAALRAELRALQARTDPHFLFNSLNAVASLIEEDPAKAEQVLEQLSGLFRYALTAPSRSSVALDEELAAVGDYLSVQQVRMADRLATVVTVEEGCGALQVPPFVLQPLVDNAVRHGVDGRKHGGTVRVTAARDGEALVLTVADDGVGMGASTVAGSGTALLDLADRLSLAYGPAATVTHTTGDGPRPGHIVVVRLPCFPPGSAHRNGRKPSGGL